MAITMMCAKDAPGAVRSDYWSKSNGGGHEIYLLTEYVGCVVSMREMNGYDDSDFYATVWDEASGSFKEFCYASTRGWTYPNGATIDASPELMAKYAEYCREFAEGKKALLASLKGGADKKPLVKGALVLVVAGRKVPLGSKGYIAAIEPNAYDAYNDKVALQLLDGAGLVWTYAKNLKTIEEN
jgi:hypothetical protein